MSVERLARLRGHMLAPNTTAAAMCTSKAVWLPQPHRATLANGGLIVRRLHRDDFERRYLALLSQLTTVGAITFREWRARFDEMAAAGEDAYIICVIEDATRGGAIVGAATLFMERRFNGDVGAARCTRVGNIEDVVVDSAYRGLRLGRRVVEECLAAAKVAGATTTVLDCDEKNIGFYKRLQLYVPVNEHQLAIYNN
jgi:glucosamine-phosphate N-acetyltransferase